MIGGLICRLTFPLPKYGIYTLVGPIAQWLEHATHNRLVLGSSPSGPTRKQKNRSQKLRFFCFLVVQPQLQGAEQVVELVLHFMGKVGSQFLTGIHRTDRSFGKDDLYLGCQLLAEDLDHP